MDGGKTHPVVLRMQGMFPADMGGYEGHRLRRGGDLGHVDSEKSKLNRRLLGDANWAAQARAELDDMKAANFAAELAKLRKRRRNAELERRIVEGPRDPWRATRHGPMREIILTANKAWFESLEDDKSFEDDKSLGPKPIGEIFGDSGDGRDSRKKRESREKRFETLALAWLQEHFGGDVIHARADLDEEVFHVHAVILPRVVTKDGRQMLQPSKHPMIKDYEQAQDSVGAWFAHIGLGRGERRAAAIRKAIEANAECRDPASKKPVPRKREHVSPRDWRREQERKLADRDRAVTERERDTGAILEMAASIADGETDVAVPEDEAAGASRQQAARSVFSRALDALRKRARQDALSELNAAHDEIRRADDAIVAVARLLPEKARRRITEARKSLAAALTRLPRMIGDKEREGPPDARD